MDTLPCLLTRPATAYPACYMENTLPLPALPAHLPCPLTGVNHPDE